MFIFNYDVRKKNFTLLSAIFHLKYRKHTSVYLLHEATKLTDFNETYASDTHIFDQHHTVQATEKSKLMKHGKSYFYRHSTP